MFWLNKCEPSYATYLYKGRVIKYHPATTLEDMVGAVRVSHGEFFKNSTPTEKKTVYRGHLVVIDEPLYEGCPRRCVVFVMDPTTHRMEHVASNILDADGPTDGTYREFIDRVRSQSVGG